MRIDTLKKRLNEEFVFSESYDFLKDEFDPGAILLTPNYKDRQRPWMQKAYQQWMRGDRTIVLVAPMKPSCNYYKKYLTDVAEVRRVKGILLYNNQRVKDPMIIAVYWKRPSSEPNFIVSFD
jgi:hypothetical protein